MQTLGFFYLIIGLLFIFYNSSPSIAFTKVQVPITRRHLTKQTTDPDDFKLEVDPTLKFENPRLKKAYYAFQEWKKAIYSDPQNLTGNWVGPDVCSYEGVVCVHSLDDPNVLTVALIDLNYGDIAGHLVPHLSLLSDLGVFHINSNRFSGTIPTTLSKLDILFEFDVSNNRFVGPFPKVVLSMPSLRFLDLRYNDFEGTLPPELFEKRLDAIVVNNNRFHSNIPENIGNSSASMLVLANNKFTGCIPKSFGSMPRLEQVSISNNKLTGCLPEEIGNLKKLRVLDVSENGFTGPLPKSLDKLKGVERFDFSVNQLTGKVHESVCNMPALLDFRISSNYFSEISGLCDKLVDEKLLSVRDKHNCLPKKPDQRSDKICLSMMNRQIDCKTISCSSQNRGSDESGDRKTPQHRLKPPYKPAMSLLKPSPVSQPKTLASPPPPSLPPPALPSPDLEDIIIPTKIGSRYSSPPPPVTQGY